MKEPEFLWGAATSSHQVEGDCRHNDWWAWEESGHIEGGVRSGRATDHWNRFENDLRLAKSLGLNSYRFSVEWSRLEPEEGKWDEEAFFRYNALIDACFDLGLAPMLTIHHFTLPRWFAEQGGLSSDKAAEKFLTFVRKLTQSLQGRIHLWCTINEPMVLVAGSHLAGFMPPGDNSPQRASRACANLLRWHTQSYDFLHESLKREARRGPWAKAAPQVGYAHNVLDIHAERSYHPIERVVALAFDRLYNRSWVEATLGEKQKFSLPFILPKPPVVTEALGRARADFIGLNYYTKANVQWRPRAKADHQIGTLPLSMSFAGRKELASDLDWAIHPKGLGRMLRRFAHYGRPLIITENGLADRDDSRRPDFLRSHIREIALARAEGIDIRGYYHWSLLDNFEWIKGYWPRFGLFAVDYQTLERKATPSAAVYRDLISSFSGGPPKT